MSHLNNTQLIITIASSQYLVSKHDTPGCTMVILISVLKPSFIIDLIVRQSLIFPFSNRELCLLEIRIDSLFIILSRKSNKLSFQIIDFSA